MPVTLDQWMAHRRRQRNLLRPPGGVSWNDLTIFAVTCAGAVSVNLVGSLPGDEIIILILIPFLAIYRGKVAFRREYLWFYILLGCWLFGTVTGDLYLGTPLADKLKGIARVVFLGLDFAALAILIDRRVRGFIVFLLADAALQYLASNRFGAGPEGAFLTQWKYGLGQSVAILALLVSSYFFSKRRYSICILISLGLAALNLIFAFRSQLAVNLMSAVIVLPISGPSKAQASRPLDGMDLFKLSIVLALAGGAAYATNQVVKYAAAHDFFDEAIASKFESQSGGQLGVLFGGRPETLVAIQAIADSPIIGHGSFAVSQYYLQMMQDIQYRYGYAESDEPADIETPGIPTHSHLTQAWVESGILGGIFWIYVLVLTGRMFVHVVLWRPALMPLYSFVALSFMWDVLYSPMGSYDRLLGAFVMLLSIDLVHSRRRKPAPARPRAFRPIYRKTIAGMPRGRR